MSHTEERNLALTPRNVGTRNRRPNRTIPFELTAIMTRFVSNLSAIKAQFDLAEQLKADGNLQYKDILRSQVVFLDSAFDFFMHEATKYGMVQIFQGIWEKTEKYNNFTVRYKFPNLPYYRGAADQVFFLGRPLGRFGLSSAGFFLGLPRFLGAGLGIGFERPRASSSSNT